VNEHIIADLIIHASTQSFHFSGSLKLENLGSPIDLQTHLITLWSSPLTFQPEHQCMPSAYPALTTCLTTLLLIAQAVFLPECGHTDTDTHNIAKSQLPLIALWCLPMHQIPLASVMMC